MRRSRSYLLVSRETYDARLLSFRLPFWNIFDPQGCESRGKVNCRPLLIMVAPSVLLVPTIHLGDKVVTTRVVYIPLPLYAKISIDYYGVF